MNNVFALDATERAALRPEKRASEVLAIGLPEGVRASTMQPLLARMVAVAEMAAAVGASLQSVEHVPGPATVVALRDREAAWRDVHVRYGLLTAPEVARAAGSRSTNLSEYGSAIQRSGRALAIRRAGRLLFPGFQFDVNGSPHRRLKDILTVFHSAEWSPESTTLWFTSPNGYLDGKDPAMRLAVDPDEVMDAARNATADW